MFGFAGAIIGSSLLEYIFPRASRRKIAKSPKGLQVMWQERSKTFEEDSPSVASLEKHVKLLDGKKLSIVTALRGAAYMDICGDVNGEMVVYFSSDAADEDLWQLLSSPGAEHGEVEVMIAWVVVEFALWQTTVVRPVVMAARHFVATGEADPRLTWYASKEIYDRRPIA